ncbi:MAG: hypothetical protein ACLP1Y_15900, partial [Candidatus Acidiferrales bacterium]
NSFLRARNDDGVKAEKKSGERGGKRPEKNAAIHRSMESMSASHDKGIAEDLQTKATVSSGVV